MSRPRDCLTTPWVRRGSATANCKRISPLSPLTSKKAPISFIGFYIAEGFLDAVVEKPHYAFHDDTGMVDALISVNEGRQYFFGQITFSGNTIYDSELLRGQIKDLLDRPLPKRALLIFRAGFNPISRRVAIMR